MSFLLSGIDILLTQPPAWRTSRIALVTNHAATTNLFESARVALVQAGFNIVNYFRRSMAWILPVRTATGCSMAWTR